MIVALNQQTTTGKMKFWDGETDTAMYAEDTTLLGADTGKELAVLLPAIIALIPLVKAAVMAC